jgi:hypothetical protein
MAINQPAAYGIYPQDVSLQQVVHALNQSGFGKEDICLMVSPKHPLATVVREANILHAERGVGAATAGMMAWLMKFGAVMIPTVGLFIRSKAFLEALLTEQGNPPYARSNGLVELGFSVDEADRFETKLAEMGVLVYIACAEEASTRRAAEMMQLTGAYGVASLESTLPYPVVKQIPLTLQPAPSKIMQEVAA